MTFKEKLVILRKSKGLTQDEFASAVGVSRQAVYKWESGQSYPEVPKLLEIKLLFTISIDDLLDDSYEIPVPEKKKKRASAPKAPAAPKAESKPAPAPAPVAEPAPAAAVPHKPYIPTVPKVEAQPAPVVNPAPTAPVVDTVPAPTPEELSATTIDVDDLIASDEQEKKGFFGRLFGRR